MGTTALRGIQRNGTRSNLPIKVSREIPERLANDALIARRRNSWTRLQLFRRPCNDSVTRYSARFSQSSTQSGRDCIPGKILLLCAAAALAERIAQRVVGKHFL